MRRQLTPQLGPCYCSFKPREPNYIAAAIKCSLVGKDVHKQDALAVQVVPVALMHVQDPGCGDLPYEPITERFLFPLHTALHAGMPIG
jgi:hypothetical protein